MNMQQLSRQNLVPLVNYGEPDGSPAISRYPEAGRPVNDSRPFPLEGFVPFITQLAAGSTRERDVPLYHVIQPSGSRVEVPPLIEQDARELASLLNVTAECAEEDDG
jgi:hypothetical protein